MFRLNLGSGLVKGCRILNDEWTNVDFAAFEEDKGDWSTAKYLNFNMEGPFPIDSESVDAIFASHVLEHFSLVHIHEVLKSCFRILKPGCPIRIICPDPRIFAQNFMLKNEAFIIGCYGQQNYDRWGYKFHKNLAFTDMFYGDHYSHVSIVSVDMVMIDMIHIGFTKVMEMTSGNTMYPEHFLESKETHETGVFGNRPIMSWYLEGER